MVLTLETDFRALLVPVPGTDGCLRIRGGQAGGRRPVRIEAGGCRWDAHRAYWARERGPLALGDQLRKRCRTAACMHLDHYRLQARVGDSGDVDIATLPALVKAALREVAAEYGIPERSLVSRRRFDQLAEPRHVLMYVLTRTGITMAEAARLFRRNHSTICHSVGRVRGSADMLTRADELALRLGAMLPDPDETLPRAVERITEGLPAATRALVRAYIRTDLLGVPTNSTALGRIMGLRALTHDLNLCLRLVRALRRHDHHGAVHLLGAHARRLGYPAPKGGAA